MLRVAAILPRMSLVLYIGNKNYSSWSLRPWLVLRWSGLPFEERVLQLGGQGYGKAQIPAVVAVSPSGKVPALELDGLTVWDSLAIAETVAERAPAARLWPEDPSARALARAATAEMHSGFAAIRRDLSMNVRRRTTKTSLAEDTRADLERVERLWTQLRERYGAAGPFLLGERCIADAFFTPVATRFRTYGIPLSASSQAYCDALLADADFRAWEQDAEREAWTMPATDAL